MARRAAAGVRDNRRDAALTVALLLVGLVARHGALPHDGLVYDDAWVAVGAMKGGAGDLLTVSTNHPGFTALLMVWSRLVPAGAEALTVPTYVGASLTAPVLFVVVRRLGMGWPVSLLAGALAAVAPPHVYYSGRVKSYAVEATLILLIALLVSRVVPRRWTWATAGLWVTAAVLLGTFSVFTLVAVAVATVVVALHPAGDRLQRWVALAVQGAVQVGYLAIVQSSFDSSQVARDWEEVYDGYIELHGPMRMIRQLGAHLARVGETVTVGGKALTLGVAVVALAALAWEAWRGPRAIAARFLLALPAVALAGSIAGQIPFGPMVGNVVFPGTRASLWLLPSLIVGLAFGAERAVDLVRRRAAAAARPLAAGIAVAAAVLVAVRIDDPLHYLDSGAGSADAFVEEHAGARDVVVVLPNGQWTYASAVDAGADVRPAPHTPNGFRPRLHDQRVWMLPGWDGTTDQLRQRVAGAPRVFVVNGFVSFGDQYLPQIEAALVSFGYRERPGTAASQFEVSMWERPGAPAP